MIEKRQKEINQLKNNINIILKYVNDVSQTRGYLLNEKEKEAFNYLKKYIERDF